MDIERGSSTARVLVISRHRDFAAAVSGQLHDLDVAVQLLSPEEGREIDVLRDRAPDIAFVDFDAKTTDAFPLHRAIASALPDCQVVLTCTREQVAGASRLVHNWEVFDYVLTDVWRDPHRIPLLVQRARTASLPRLAEARGFVKMQYRRILETLAELRAILKDDRDDPVVKLIREHQLRRDVPAHADDSCPDHLAQEYQQCLVDLICGRLRRLENDVSLANGKLESEAAQDDNNAILIVEDEMISAEILKYILERNGFSAVVATSPEAAKLAMRKFRPRLVLMDIHLGAADGLQLVRMMRRAKDYSHVPVLVITSDRMRATVGEAASIGVQGYLLKPYDPKELIEKVRNALERGRSSTATDPARQRA